MKLYKIIALIVSLIVGSYIGEKKFTELYRASAATSFTKKIWLPQTHIVMRSQNEWQQKFNSTPAQFVANVTEKEYRETFEEYTHEVLIDDNGTIRYRTQLGPFLVVAKDVNQPRNEEPPVTHVEDFEYLGDGVMSWKLSRCWAGLLAKTIGGGIWSACITAGFFVVLWLIREGWLMLFTPAKKETA